MRAAVRVICRPATALGVALAGITPLAATDGETAAAQLATLAEAPARGGIVLIEASLYAALPPATRRQLRRDGLPIVMPFPGPEPRATGAAPEEELLDILRRAVGYRLRLR